MRRIPRLSLLLGLAVTACGPGSRAPAPPRPIALPSAFPAELAPLVAAARIDEIVLVGGCR